MSRLGQIYKHEKVEGGGVISTLSKRGKEKFDPRQFFDQDGLLANMLPGLFKSYKAIPKRKQYEVKYQRLNDINSNINVLKAITLTIAKNTSVLPAIQRDTNIMRQNLVNLVRIMGGKPTSTTDEFFKNAQEREKFYEKQFEDKDKNSPEKVSDPNKKEGIDWMKWGIIGGVVVAGIAKYFSDPEFREKVNGMVNSFGKTVFGEENWKSIKENISKGIENSITFIGDLFKEHIGGLLIGLGSILAPFALLKLAIEGITSTLKFASKQIIKTIIKSFGSDSAKDFGLGDAVDAADTAEDLTKSGKGKAKTGPKRYGGKTKLGRIMEVGKNLVKKSPKSTASTVAKVAGSGVGIAAGAAVGGAIIGDATNPSEIALDGKEKIEWNIKDIERRIKDYETNIIPNTNKQVYDTTKEKERHINKVNEELEKLKSELKIRQEDLKNYKYHVYPTEGQETRSSSPTKVGSLVDESLKNRKSSDGEVLFNKLMDEKGIEDKELRSVLRGLAITESTMNPNARGPVIPPPEPGKKPSIHVGDQAHGLFQIMPKTAEEMGYSRSDIKDPEKAARAGLEYFLKNYKKFGDSGLAVLAHHAGPGRVNEYLKTGKIDTKDLATGLSTNDYYKKVMKNASTDVQPQNDAPKSTENKKYPNILDIFDGIGSLVKNVPSEVSKEFPGVTKELEKGWGEMRSYAMKRLELPPVVVNNQQPQQPPSNQGVPQNLASISSVVDQDFVALLFNKSMWGSPVSSV